MPFRGRIAYPSYVDESLFGNPHEKAVQMARSMPASLKDAVVVTGAEIRGMQNRSKLGAPAPSTKQLDRQRLHALSNARKSQWPNTIEALREKKDRARQEKLDAEEKLRVEIDREEEALQAEKRRLAIERANKMLYDSTDRVKSLHSKLMLADVMEERERQIEVKQRQRLREVEAEERWYQKQQDAIRRMDAEEDLRDEEEMIKRAEVGKVRAEQIEAQKHAQTMKLNELKREGEMMKQMAIADAEAEQRQRLEEMEREKRNRAEVRRRATTHTDRAAAARVPPLVPLTRRVGGSTATANLCHPASRACVSPPHLPRPLAPSPPRSLAYIPLLSAFLLLSLRSLAPDSYLRRARSHDQVVEANAYLLKKRAEDQELQDAEEARMLEYAAQKEKDLLERRDREEARFRERQAWRQQLIDRQIAKLTDLNAASNTRLANQAAEVQAKAQEARARLDEQRKNELLVMHFSRQQQMRWKAERKAQETRDDEHYASELKKLNVQLREEEAMAIRDRFEKAKGRDAYLLKQMAEKAAYKEEEKLEEMFEAEATKQWSQDDNAIFDQYAQMCLDEYVAAGKDPKPIELVMKKIKHRAD